jgi:hypothetical protein
VHYVTALGTDTFSQQMLESWQGEQVKTPPRFFLTVQSCIRQSRQFS